MKHRPLNPQYFRDYAEILGCPNVSDLGDLAVWNYIRKIQGKTVIEE